MTSQPYVFFCSDFYNEFVQLQTQIHLHGAAQQIARPTRLHSPSGLDMWMIPHLSLGACAFTFLGLLLLLLARQRRLFLTSYLFWRLPWHVADKSLSSYCYRPWLHVLDSKTDLQVRAIVFERQDTRVSDILYTLYKNNKSITKMRDNDFEEILPSPSPSLSSVGSASTETTTDETCFVLPKLSFFGDVLRCSMPLDVGYEIIFVLHRCEDEQREDFE